MNMSDEIIYIEILISKSHGISCNAGTIESDIFDAFALADSKGLLPRCTLFWVYFFHFHAVFFKKLSKIMEFVLNGTELSLNSANLAN